MGVDVRRTRFDEWPCPIARATDLIGDWWTPLVLRDLMFGAQRFEQLADSLGAPRAVLAARLKRLVDEAMVERTAYQQRPERFEYRLTDKGQAFGDVLLAMWRWGEDWMWADGEHPVVALKSRSTGERVTPVVVDEATGERLSMHTVRVGRNR
jgi:DNA-binding HxlR family transcriptional regulator